jgi:hypothetical protein
MAGSIRLKPGGKWLPFEARQVLAPPRGFVWRAVVRAGLLRFAGADHYAAGSGGVDFSLWGVIPLVRASGPEADPLAVCGPRTPLPRPPRYSLGKSLPSTLLTSSSVVRLD